MGKYVILPMLLYVYASLLFPFSPFSHHYMYIESLVYLIYIMSTGRPMSSISTECPILPLLTPVVEKGQVIAIPLLLPIPLLAPCNEATVFSIDLRP